MAPIHRLNDNPLRRGVTCRTNGSTAAAAGSEVATKRAAPDTSIIERERTGDAGTYGREFYKGTRRGHGMFQNILQMD